MKYDLKKKTEDELIDIINSPSISEIPYPIKIAAKIELEKRQTRTNKSTNKLTFWIFVFTLLLLLWTTFIFFFPSIKGLLHLNRSTLKSPESKSQNAEHKR